MRPDRLDLLGLPLDPVDRDGLLRAVSDLVDAGGRGHKATVAYLNIHVANEARRHPDLADFLRAVDLCYCDGEGVRLGARVLGHHLRERITGADWIYDLASLAAQKGWRLAWIGGEPGVTAAAAAALTRRYPGLSIHPEHGFHPKDGPEDDALLARVNAAQPHIVLVGMGTPTQERWLAARRHRLDTPVAWVLGATADFVSGHVPRGPAFLHQNHEWLARLITDPRRLWRRYLIGNTWFLLRVLRQAARS